LHNLGYVHNDIKPDNILLGSRDRTRIESSEIVLIDFGITKSYKSPSMHHIEEQGDQGFKGNLFFSSHNAL
jgi:serine/threonine protein kinase